MDRVSQVLAQGAPPGVPDSYRALADHCNIPHYTLHHRARGRRSIEEKAQSQQYLTPWEEDVVVKFVLHMSNLGQPIRIKFIPSIAVCVTAIELKRTDHESLQERTGQALENRHPELQARRVSALDWNRHEKSIYEKVTHWFKVIRKILQDPAILAENV